MNEPLEIASFRPSVVDAGASSGWRGSELFVDTAAIASSAAVEPGIATVEVEIVRPAERVRLLNVLDAVEPSIKAEDADATFPGALGRLSVAGRGRTHRLDGIAVLPVADLRGAGYSEAGELPDSVVDMAGPGAPLCAWASTSNVVVRFEPDPGAPLADVDRSIRRVTLRVARDLAGTTLESTAPLPDDLEHLVSPAGESATPELPSLCVILQVGAEGLLADTFLYGASMEGMVPTLLDPAEVLDGALTSGAYDWAGLRNPTAFYQRNRLVRELMAAHGKRLHFRGVIVALGYLNSAFEKSRSAMLAAALAQRVGAEGAVLTTFSSGNSHTDTMLTARACAELGIATTAILAETNGGLTDHVSEADSIVSVGNEDELVPGWVPSRVIGGSRLVDGCAADDDSGLPSSSYLGALSEMGDMALTAVPA
ncbi:MAG: glycine/sarcosine/betaine reductase component B subunit [Actinomycetota bacterium]|nr:glycine/sarcosine/betaine reductase component B subunit [Actinomycetota bacterium]